MIPAIIAGVGIAAPALQMVGNLMSGKSPTASNSNGVFSPFNSAQPNTLAQASIAFQKLKSEPMPAKQAAEHSVALVGSKAAFVDPHGNLTMGQIESARLEGGQVILQIGGRNVPLSVVQQVYDQVPGQYPAYQPYYQQSSTGGTL